MPTLQHYHLVGIAGSGMSALAQALRAAGHRVSGSDRYLDQRENLEVFAKLQHIGVELHPQDGTGVTPACTAVVTSTAIESNNPDLEAARQRGVRIIHRAEMLAGLIPDGCSIAVTGTSGKSTVAGMLGWVLEQLGWDPSVILGAPVINWMDGSHIGNMRPGKSNTWVFEADESDRSLLLFHPDWAVITNISHDHFPVEQARDLFLSFRQQVRKGCIGVLDDQEMVLPAFAPSIHQGGSSFRYNKIEFHLALPGRHNAENAFWVVRMCEKLGLDLRAVSRVLPQFRGIHRRLERIGVSRGVLVVDDFAHNPAKIRAAWDSYAPYHDCIMAIWRPHGYGPLYNMLDELAETLAGMLRPADRFLVLPIYDAGGTANRRIHHRMLTDHPLLKGAPVWATDGTDEAVERVVSGAKTGDLIITMGARDPGLPMLARTILRQLNERDDAHDSSSSR